MAVWSVSSLGGLLPAGTDGNVMNQDAGKDEPAPVRTRGRARFSSTEEFAKIPEQPTRTTSNRRPSTRTRIHSNNPKAAADRRALPTEVPSRGYAVEEINNDSPIDSFRRQSKSRVLTESRFEIADASAARRPAKYEASTRTPPIVNAVPVEDLGFGSTARAILQSRGESLPGKTTTPVVDEEYLLTNFGSTIRSFRGDSAPPKTTTTPVVDEEYLLTNFGSTIRSLAAASRGAQVALSRSRPRNDIPVQKATPIRSEIPILDREDIPARRTSIRGEPLPSLRNSDITIEREPPARSRNSAKAKLAESRENARIDSERKLTTEEAVIEDFVRVAPAPEAPDAVQGLPEQSELITETQPFEVSSETALLEEEEVRRTPAVEISTPSSTYSLPTKRVVASGRRSGTRGRNFQESEGTQSPRSRPTRPPRPIKTSEERDSGTPASSRARISSRRRFDDAVVAESRHRGPSVFTAEQYQDVTARSRTGRRIDSRYESVPERISVDLTPSTTIRSRTSGRRATTAGSTTTDRASVRDRNTRGRGRSRSEPTVAIPTNRPGSKISSYVEETRPTRRSRDSGFNARKPSIVENNVSSNRRSKEESVPVTRRPNNVEDVVLYGERSDNLVNARDIITRAEINELKVNNRRSSSIQNAPPSRRRGGTSRFEIPDDIINERITSEQTRKEKPSSIFDLIQTRTRNPNRNVASSRQTESIEETTIYYGEKSRRTDPPDTTTTTTTTTTTEKPIVKSNTRSRSRFPESPPRLDESKLEVLPLFEREPKAVASTRSRGQRSRSVSRRNSEDHMHISATENDVRFVEKPTTSAFTRVTVTRTESIEASTSRARLSTRTASPTTTETPRRSSSSSSSSSTIPTTTRVVTTTTKPPVTTSRASETTTKKWVTRSPPVIKESVVAEINQVTSKSTITRRKKVPKAKAAEMLSRGIKKADVRLSDVGKKKNSDEEIDEEDNYPEPFKALIQAKKNKDESRPQQSSTRSATSATISKSTTTQRVIVTSVGVPRSSSTARVVTTPVAPRKSQELDDFINDIENELDPKPVTSSKTTTTDMPTRGRQLPKFSEKPKYQQRHKEKFGKSTEKPRFSPEKHPTKTTSSPRKTYSTKSYSTRASSEHHLRRKALRSTAFPPSTTPLTIANREAKFSAKFVKKENKVPETSTADKSAKFIGNQSPKGLYSSRKGSSNESVDDEEKVARQLDVSLNQSAKPTQTIKKFGSSRYSSRYRSDTSTRSSVLKSTTSAPFYIPTIPTPAYLPTVPTITPPVTPVDGIVAVKDGDLGVEVISFDDPINLIPSADLVNGEYLTTDKNLKLSPTVKEGTTEKPVSIIERIINSITLISTTAAPNTSTINSSSTTTEAPGNSAILKLATKKTTPKDKTKPDVQTNIIETITSEKPTTIIEKIRSSLSAIQTNEVGTSDFNIVSSSSTTPLSTVTKYSAKYRGSSVGTTALPAPQPLSTSINPLTVFDEIDKSQVLEKRTIGKLLNILNGLVSTESSDKAAEKLVVVTPKSSLSSVGFVATTVSPQEPIEAIPLNAIEQRASFSDLSSTNSLTTESLLSTVNTESTTLSSPTVNTEPHSTSTPVVNTDSTTVEAATLSTEPANTEMSTLEASTVTMALETTTSTPLASNTETLTTTTDIPITTSQPPSTATVDNTGSILYTFPSTFPSIPTIQVESNRMARILESEQRSTGSLPRVVITSTTTNAPVSTTSVSSTTSATTTNAPKTTTTLNSMPSTTDMESTMTTTPGTTLLTSTMTMNTASTILAPTVVIMAVPGETRISKSQSTTTRSTETSTISPSTAEATTVQASSSTIVQNTETIPPTLGEILNGRTVDALNNLIKFEVPSTKAPNYKNLQVNQNAIVTSTTTDSSTLTTAQSTDSEAPFTSSILSTEKTRQIPSSSESNTVLSTSTDASTITTALSTDSDAPFTSMLSTEGTTQIPNTSDALLSSTLITTIMPESSTTQSTTTTTTTQPTTTTLRTTTPEIKTTTRKIETTTRKLTTTPLPKTTTEGFPTFTPSNIFPNILTTLFPSLMRGGLPTESHISSTRRPFSSAELMNNIGDRFEILSTAGTTAQPSTVRPQTSSQRISTTTVPTTTTRLTTTTTQTTTQAMTTTTTTTTEKPTTTATRITTRKPESKPTTSIPKVSHSGTPMPTTKEETDKVFNELKKSGKLKDLNEEQRRNLAEIEQIEEEQAELLKQLSLLTTMFGGQNGRAPNIPIAPNPLGGNSNSLANRIIAMAMERDKARGSASSPVPSSTASPAPSPTTTTKKPTRRTTKRPNSIQDQLPITKVEDATKKTTPSLEDVLKQYNLNGLTTPVPLTSTYGKTDEAVLAAILKEHGIGPTTPKILADKVKEAGVFEEVPTTKKPKPRARPVTTTARPLGGRLMQGLNWLLDILDPPTTKKPAPRKTKPKTQTPKQTVVEEELLTNQPTRITPMVTAAPATRPSLSQDEIQVLIKQLESVQANPDTADQLDFSKIKSLQNLIDVNEGVQVTHTGQHGATSRATPRPQRIKSTTQKDHFLSEINRQPKASTISTLSVSNSVDDDVELISTTVRNRVMPPVSLNPIPGIDDTGDSVIRSNLLTAAVNVTRAISSFLGSAIQDASQQVRAMFYNGSSGILNTFSTGSSVPSIASVSGGVSPSEGS